MEYEITIGLETHIMQKTKTKMFCGCLNLYNALPNTNVCFVCLGYPGALPVINKKAVELCCKAGLLLGCNVNTFSKWDRKNYFYPDMAKNYQITQNDYPLCSNGFVEVEVKGKIKKFDIERIHQEENAAKNSHYGKFSNVDYNRAGTALMEIVSKPCMHSTDDVLAYMTSIKQIMQYGGISNCDQEKGQMRSDVNISVRLKGEKELGAKVEIKNMNSFSFIIDAINYESQRQINILSKGGFIEQQTRGYDSERGETFLQRTKEDAHDYRYFPEPDLLPIILTTEQIKTWSSELPELPHDRQKRYVSLGLPEYDAKLLTNDIRISDWFDEVAKYTKNIKIASNFIMGDIMRITADTSIDIFDSKLSPKDFAEIVDYTHNQKISVNSARQLIEIIFNNGGSPHDIINEKEMIQISDDSLLISWIDEVILNNPKPVQEYKDGNNSSINFIIGQVMKISKGKANPSNVMEIIKNKLS
ncbi:MAG: Asp-tRNA(Asn)/Glu-tRNA(Gln) amidotransferase subunit GatB [Verrucomicrobiota bacterium]|nr:Asp-tRNA(Asn)/Glu-tRNA(Gln) amidotransferase subunit GatB [Verrucomicrobiota bacterium]